MNIIYEFYAYITHIHNMNSSRSFFFFFFQVMRDFLSSFNMRGIDYNETWSMDSKTCFIFSLR